MSASVSRPAEQTGRRGRLWWLPAGGHGNGLDDDTWAPVLEVSEQVVARLLRVLGEGGVPAYAVLRAPAPSGSGTVPVGRDGYQLWVGASAYGQAEITGSRAMPSLTREAARHARQRVAVTVTECVRSWLPSGELDVAGLERLRTMRISGMRPAR